MQYYNGNISNNDNSKIKGLLIISARPKAHIRYPSRPLTATVSSGSREADGRVTAGVTKIGNAHGT